MRRPLRSSSLPGRDLARGVRDARGAPDARRAPDARGARGATRGPLGPGVRTVGLARATLVGGLVVAGVAGATALEAQDTTRLAPSPTGATEWNTPRALELVERARDRRRLPVADSALRSYRADVTGHIYFFLDREDEPKPVLLRADQVALDLYWGQPDRVKQVIRGMRSEEQFPLKDFRYYVDRYTVIQNGFDDVIRVGEGRDVRNVIHPLARQGRGIYEFRLGDSTTIRLPGQPDPLRVYEIQVRPRRYDIPAIVGSLFVERARGDLVRLAFTFTPSSYLDPRNERVEIMLENALWEGQYWLPREQRLLVRREIPEIDLDVGTVIRGVLRVQDYDLNIDLPDDFFRGREVVMAEGPERLAAYPFDAGLYEGFADVGLEGAEPGTLDAVDMEAITGRILRERFLRGVPRVRFFAPSASDILRFDRSEGLVTGVGLALGVGRSQAYLYGGWAWGSQEPVARVGWRPAGPDPSTRLLAEAYVNRPLDLGLRTATAGVLSSASAALLGQDYRDILPVTGASVGWRWGGARSRSTVSLSVERIDAAEQARSQAPGAEDRAFRPVAFGVRADQAALAWEHEQRRTLGPASLFLRPRLEAGVVSSGYGVTDGGTETGPFARAGLHADARWTDYRRTSGVEGRLTASAAGGHVHPHHFRYVGGPGTLPGHSFHDYTGSLAAVADVAVWRQVVPRLVRARVFGAVGWAGGEELRGGPIAAHGLEPWTPRPLSAPRASVGVGLGFLDGLMRVDYALPLDSRGGVLILSVDPDLWSFL